MKPPGYRPLLVSTGIRASALRSPTKMALSCADRTMDYATVVDRMNRVANLARDGLRLAPGTRVALMLPNAIEFLELVCGLADAGMVAVALNPQAAPREIDYILEDAGAPVLFVHHTVEARARIARLAPIQRTIVIGPEYEALLAAAANTEPTAPIEETDIFAIIYTSGTTGEPKGVMLPHRSRTHYMLLAMATNQGRSQPGMRALAVAPMANGAGFINALAPIWFGGACHILESFDAETLLREIEARQITTIFLVPTHFHAIFALPPETLAHHDVRCLQTIVAGAAALPQATKERIVAHFGEGRLFEGYGSTEAGGITGLRPEDQLQKPQSVGRPLTGVELRILDAEDRPVPPGTAGEIICRSPMLFAGYLNRPEATAEALADGWYRTGDIGVLDEDGYLSIVDRKKDMIVSGGQNIFPREIEEILYRHPCVAEAAVVGRPDPYWGEAVTAYVVPTPGATIDPAALKAHCAQHLAPYKIPKTFNALNTLPKNANGKTLNKILRTFPPP